MRRSTHYLKNKFRPYSIFEDKYSFIKSKIKVDLWTKID